MDAFTALYRYYQPRLQYRLMPFCSSADAENIIQEVFLKLWIKRSILPQINSLEGLLVKMSRDLLIDWRRSTTASGRRESKAASGEAVTTPSWQLEYKEFYATVLQVIASLPPRQQHIYTLRVMEERSLDEIAGISGLSKAVVVKQLYLATKTVRARLRKPPKKKS